MPRETQSESAETVELEGGLPLDPTSSLNKYFMCVCSKRYKHKSVLIRHIATCSKLCYNKNVVCRWCKLEFKNRGNLINHSYHMHGVLKPTKAEFKCDVCDARFGEKWKLKFHIRRDHFNLWARIPHANAKQINQVWFEKVLNTNLVMEMKKTGVNRLIMKPTPLSADLKIHSINKRVDLRHYYPVNRSKEDGQCKLCGKILRKVDVKKHMDEIHFKVAKHKCNNCNMTFKRSYIYLQHVCHKHTNRRAKVNGVRHMQNSSIRITSVETLNSVVID